VPLGVASLFQQDPDHFQCVWGVRVACLDANVVCGPGSVEVAFRRLTNGRDVDAGAREWMRPREGLRLLSSGVVSPAPVHPRLVILREQAFDLPQQRIRPVPF
jgi:hypothetical protein